MYIPNGFTKREILDVLDNVANRLADRFRFSYHTRDDLYQEAVILGIEALPKYKPGRPLENFLFIHVKNRLCTFKRDRYVRPASDKPCYHKCPFNCYVKKDDYCGHYEGAGLSKMDCDIYAAWVNRNTAKQNIKDALHYSQVKPDNEPNMSYEVDFINAVDGREILEKVEKKLPVEFMKDFQCLVAGIEIPKQNKMRLLAKMKDILHISNDIFDDINEDVDNGEN